MNPYNIQLPVSEPVMAQNAGRVIGLNHALQIGAECGDGNGMDRARNVVALLDQKIPEYAVHYGVSASREAATEASLKHAFQTGPGTNDREAVIQWMAKWAPVMTLLEVRFRLQKFIESFEGTLNGVDVLQAMVGAMASEIELIPGAYPACMFLGGAQQASPPMFVEPGDPRIPRGGIILHGATRIFIAANADLTEGEDDVDDEDGFVAQTDGRECLAILAGRPAAEVVQIGRLCMVFDVMQMYGSFLERNPERDTVANVFINVVQMQQRIAEQLEGQGLRLNYEARNQPPAGADVATCFKIGQHDFLVEEMRLIKKAKDENRMVSHAMKFFERLSNETTSILASLEDAKDFPHDAWIVGRKQLRKPLEETAAHVLGLAMVTGQQQPALIRLKVAEHHKTTTVKDVAKTAGLTA